MSHIQSPTPAFLKNLSSFYPSHPSHDLVINLKYSDWGLFFSFHIWGENIVVFVFLCVAYFIQLDILQLHLFCCKL